MKPNKARSRYIWSVNWRDAKGKTMGLSSSNIEGLLEDALRFNAVAITLHRERKCGPTISLESVRGILSRKT